MRKRPVPWTSSFVLALVGCVAPDPGARELEVKKEVAAPRPAPVVEEEPEPTPAELLQRKIDRFIGVELKADVSGLPESERQALDKLIEAARLIDPIYERQAWAGNPDLRTRLAQDISPLGQAQLDYFTIMRGPWDRQDDDRAFIDGVQARPLGAGFYPEDLKAEEFRAWVEGHPRDKKALQSPVTVIVREGGGLAARGYSAEYRGWLEPAARALEEAAGLTQNASLQKFLRARAKAFLNDDYYQSDKDWMDLDGAVEITIGPYETYEDELLGLKAGFEAFVTVSDARASEELAKFKKYLPEMEQHLPVPDEVKTRRGSASPIRVVDLVFTSGEARQSVQTIAFNLPNDERVRAEKGAKKVLLRNLIEAKFNMIMRPIGAEVLHRKHVESLSAEAFFHQVLFHELSHSLGPAFVGGGKGGKKVDVRVALEASYSPLEEAKADVMGVYNVLFMIEKGELPASMREPLLVSYFAGLFRSLRFGVGEAHGRGAALQLGRFVAAGAAVPESTSGKFTVDTAKLEEAIAALVRDICVIQHAGDKAAADALLAEHGVVTPVLQRAIDRLGAVPVDVRPLYPLAGEVLPK